MQISQKYNLTFNTEIKPTGKSAEFQKSSNELLTGKEKQLFAEMFPNNQADVLNYNFYGKSGKMNSVQIGSNFDRRG